MWSIFSRSGPQVIEDTRGAPDDPGAEREQIEKEKQEETDDPDALKKARDWDEFKDGKLFKTNLFELLLRTTF